MSKKSFKKLENFFKLFKKSKKTLKKCQKNV